MAVAGHAGALDAPVTEQVEVTLGTMVDTLVHYCRVSSPLGQSGPLTQDGASS